MSAAKDIEYLAAFTDDIVGISYTKMLPANTPYLFSMSVTAWRLRSTIPRQLRWRRRLLFLDGDPPTRRSRCGLPCQRARVRVAVCDVLGRRLRTLVDGPLPAGNTDLAWDGRDRTGALAKSGVYFISLMTEETRRTVRVPLIR